MTNSTRTTLGSGAVGVSAPARSRGRSARGRLTDLRQLLREYEASTPASRAFHDRLGQSLAGGETRAVTYFDPYPVAVAAAEGARVTDLDGNEYVDLVNNMAALVHGHRFPPVMRALAAAGGELGTVQAMPHRYQLEFVELLVSRFPAFESVRLTNSGSEAAILALRIARRATGRDRMLMFAGGYHGMGAEFCGEGTTTDVVGYNDLDAVVDALDESVACVFVEAFLGHGGVIPAQPGFLEAVAAAAEEHGALFVLDEVQSMRNAYGGQHGVLGLRPDLILMGKAVGGGLPVGVLGGRRDLLELATAAHHDGLRHSGTFNGNVLTCAAGSAAMQALGAREIEVLNARSERLGASLEAAGRRLGMPLAVTRSGSTMCLHFLDVAPRNRAEAIPHRAATTWLHLAALLEGLCVIRGGRLNLSTVLTDDDLAVAEAALVRALERVGGLL